LRWTRKWGADQSAADFSAMACHMTPEAILTLEKIMDYCHARWEETDRAPASDFPTPDMLTGKKMAFNEVLQYARMLRDGSP